MSGFTKLFGTILASTVWQEPNATRIVWITLLSMADAQGAVSASVPGLAHVARVSLAETERALETFLAPDRYSRTPEYEGRRIVKVDGGWRLLNYEKYRAARDSDKRREDNVHYKRAERERKRQSENVSNCQECQPQSAQAEAEAEAEINILPATPASKMDCAIRKDCLIKIYDAYPRKEAKIAALKAIEKAIREVEKNGLDGESYSFTEAYEAVLQATVLYGQSPLVKRKIAEGNKQYIPHPASWFNKGSYRTPVEEWQ